MRALALGGFYSHVSTRTFRRKVPESDARSVLSTLSLQALPTTTTTATITTTAATTCTHTASSYTPVSPHLVWNQLVSLSDSWGREGVGEVEGRGGEGISGK